MIATRTKTKIKRAWCYLFHWRHQSHHTGFGWYGWHCGMCGYVWFVDWEDWAKEQFNRIEQGFGIDEQRRKD